MNPLGPESRRGMLDCKLQDKTGTPEVYCYAQEAANKTDHRGTDLSNPDEVQDCLKGHGQCETYEDYPLNSLGNIFDLAVSIVVKDVRRFVRHLYRIVEENRDAEGHEGYPEIGGNGKGVDDNEGDTFDGEKDCIADETYFDGEHHPLIGLFHALFYTNKR